jgi:uncharacterized membrane protein
MEPVSDRVSTIDILRGLVMIIMALDHTRDFFHHGTDPSDLATTTPILFFTRWITHFCAPVFVFLSGISAFLSGRKKTKGQLSLFLVKRGIWLVLVELIVFNLLLTFNPLYSFLVVQVIWVIGISMIILAAMVWLPLPLVFTIGILLVFGHNLLDSLNFTGKIPAPLWWALLHQQSFIPYGDGRFFGVLYPLIPWPGVMMLGYCLGSFYRSTYPAAKRTQILLTAGFCLTVIFVVLRWSNLYGDSSLWSPQRSPSITAVSFFNLSKYPPSLLFLLMTLGPALIVLSLLEKVKGGWTIIVSVYGRVPFFYFLFHFFIIHLACMIVFFLNGHTLAEANTGMLLFRPADFGYSLPIVYGIWITLVIVLYPVCKAYGRYKARQSHWWLSYL